MREKLKADSLKNGSTELFCPDRLVFMNDVSYGCDLVIINLLIKGRFSHAPQFVSAHLIRHLVISAGLHLFIS